MTGTPLQVSGSIRGFRRMSQGTPVVHLRYQKPLIGFEPDVMHPAPHEALREPAPGQRPASRPAQRDIRPVLDAPRVVPGRRRVADHHHVDWSGRRRGPRACRYGCANRIHSCSASGGFGHCRQLPLTLRRVMSRRDMRTKRKCIPAACRLESGCHHMQDRVAVRSRVPAGHPQDGCPPPCCGILGSVIAEAPKV